MVAFPGPAVAPWIVELLLFALAVAVLGELLRISLSRWWGGLRCLDPIERGLLDLYLGGGVFYVLAAVPLGLFDPVGVLIAIALVVGLLWATSRHRLTVPALRQTLADAAATLARPAYLVAIAAALALFFLEVDATSGVATGNTYDASLLGLYTGLLTLHGSIPTSLAPVAAVAVPYPQGSTVWFALAQGAWGLPPARTSLLVTPLFLALAPLGAFTVGRRLGGDPLAGASAALVFALLAPFTRGLVAGSNDFVLAFPLLLLLVAVSGRWSDGRLPSWGFAVGFGLLAGYDAALNPVGPQWLLVTLPVVALLAPVRWGGATLGWFGRWLAAVLAALLWVTPSLAVLLAGRGSPSLTAGAGAPLPGTPIGTSVPQALGGIDPFLFRPDDSWLSPFPVVRAELAALLVVGVFLLVVVRGRTSIIAPGLPRLLLGGGVTAALMILAFALAGGGLTGFSLLPFLSNAVELSILLFSLYAFLATVPLVWLLRMSRDDPSGTPAPERTPHRRRAGRPPLAIVAFVVAVAVLVPGIATTSTELPGQLHGLYVSYSNVTSSELDLLTWGATHLADGSRVLVAPGSVAEFLPAYDPRLDLLYPMVANYATGNASYALLVSELTNGTLDAAGNRALSVLNVTDVAVTGNDSILFRAFWPGPLLASSAFALAFHAGDAYVFVRATG